MEQVELTPAELRDLARDFGPGVLTQGEQTPGLMDRVKLDLAVQMPRQVWIRRTSTPKTNIELMGNLRVRQEPGQEMQFFGHVEPVPNRGTLELNGKQFRLTDGDINLAGPVDSTKLDVNASYEVPTQGGGNDEGILISVHARGRLDSLGLDFTSDPSMSQDDILSYIVTGRPASDNPLFERTGGGGGNTGEQVALGTLTGRDLQHGRTTPGPRRVPDPTGAGPRAHAHGRPVHGIAPVPGFPASASAQQPGPAVVVGHQSGTGLRAGVHPGALAAGEPAWRQPVAGLPLPGPPCVLSAGPRSLLALVGGAGPLAAQDRPQSGRPEDPGAVGRVRVHGEVVARRGPAPPEDRAHRPGQHGRTAAGCSAASRSCRRSASHPFDPTEMARDVVRLRRYYQRSGFPKADVDYRATYEAKPDVVNVTYRIAEGPPLTVDTLTFTGDEWSAHRARLPRPELAALRSDRAAVDRSGRRG